MTMKPIDRAYRRDAMPPTIICLHASGGSGAQWNGLAVRMGPRFRVLTPDLHGHGAAPSFDGPEEGIVAADTLRVASLAADAGGAVHLVGHSYGGAVALRVALRHPELVASLAVYEPVAMRLLLDFDRRSRSAAEVAEIALAIARDLNGGAMERAARRFVDFWSGDGAWSRLAPDRRAAFARRMPTIRAHFASLMSDAATLADYGRIAAPVLYLTGRKTRPSTRRIGELLRRALPHVDAMTFDGMDHLGPVTHAGLVAGVIARFIGDRSTTAERMAA
jgi:pimeloyl-ACP methyl ester carboxylesterase